MSPYSKFVAMIAASAVVMFGLMYLNTYAWDHVYWSQTRLFMTFIMAAGMIVVMLSFMLNMYRNSALNIGIYAFAVLLFAAGLYLVRTQTTVRDVAWMEAMIPHHSIAILTSERAEISDPRVRKLADQIIEAQGMEIAEMKALIADLNGGPAATPEIDGK